MRGYLLDVFSPASPQPLRIEFFGDVVESVRTFDPDTQRSLQDLEEAVILPVKEVLFLPEFQENAAAKLQKKLEEEGAPREAMRGRFWKKSGRGFLSAGSTIICPCFTRRWKAFWTTCRRKLF